jgi:two-component system cell cycle response regulator
MQKTEQKIFEELVATIESIACGEYADHKFEKFMRVGNPALVRRLATVMEGVCRQFESREDHLKIAIDELKTARAELEQFNARLDFRVKERTLALASANSLLESLSTTDALTGISNRRNFDEKLNYEIQRAARYSTPLNCIMFDIDYFKKVNDTYGHLFGDEVLRMIGRTLKSELRSHDIFARYGGEEFVILLPEIQIQAAKNVAEKIRKIIAQTEVTKDSKKVLVTVSLGVAAFQKENMNNGRDLIDAADKALYQAKNAGRNRTVLYDRRQ